MEPILPTPNVPPSSEGTSEPHSVSTPETAPNTAPELSQERLGQPVVTPVSADDSVLPAQQTQASTSDDSIISASDNSSPQLADDVDVIEKEWVNKAKKIVNETKDDPYKQEKEVSKLQADYLLKRYGKQLKVEE